MSRPTCLHCFRATELCLCSSFARFEIEPLIVLLVHPKEFLRTVGTARIVRCSLTNSKMIRGNGPQLDCDPTFLSLIHDSSLRPMILYPGSDSLNLSTSDDAELTSAIPNDGKRLCVFVIDGTWSLAKNMIRTSKLLSQLPKLSFDVKSASIYEFRRQPKEFCLSTVEAVSLLIDQFVARGVCSVYPENKHHQMLKAFKAMVKAQVKFNPGA